MLTLVNKETGELPAGQPEFDWFWDEYPKKEGKKYAMKCWDRLKITEKWMALAAIPLHVKKWKLEGRERQFIPDCSSWLNQARFEDEIDLTPMGVASASHVAAALPTKGERVAMPEHVKAAIAKLRAGKC